jgi:hypothetical protein
LVRPSDLVDESGPREGRRDTSGERVR